MTETLSATEYRRQTAKPKRNKYGNRKTVVDGITFDSAAEARYYQHLKLREKAGEIGGLDLQHRFSIRAENGEAICVYVADFSFWDHVEDRFRVIDVKGVETEAFKLKKKLMRVINRIEVECIPARKASRPMSLATTEGGSHHQPKEKANG